MEIALILTALGLGFASGFHCIGMCGPIALSMGLTKNEAIRFQLQNFTYNFGRVVTYSILGAFLGLIGQGFQVAGIQKYLTIAVGVLLICMALFSFGGNDFVSKISFLNKPLLKVKMALGTLLQRSDYKSRFTTGLLNGLLPCGMVYMALTASLAAGGVWQGATFMFLFGLGTFPFMFAVVFAGGIMTQAFRLKVLKLVPILMLVMGSLFIIRALELGIPYLSPPSSALQVEHNGSLQHQHGDHSTCH